jgi:hypothetical protein
MRNLDLPLRRLETLRTEGVGVMVGGIGVGAAVTLSASVFLTARLAHDTVSAIVVVSFVLLASIGPVALLLAHDATCEHLGFRLRILPAVRAMTLDTVTPAALLLLLGQHGDHIRMTRDGTRWVRLVTQILTADQIERLAVAATQRTRQLRLTQHNIDVLCDYADHNGPVSDIVSLLDLSWRELDEIASVERAVRNTLNRQAAAANQRMSGRLLRQISEPLARTAAARRHALGQLLMAASHHEGRTALAVVNALAERLAALDDEQLTMVANLAPQWRNAPGDLLDGIAHL